MELAVWEAPRELENRKELPAVIDACERLWRDHILSKMAVPEVSAWDHDATCTRLIDLLFAYGRSLRINRPLSVHLPTLRKKYWRSISRVATCSSILYSRLTTESLWR